MKIKIVAFLMLTAILSFGQTFTRTKPDPEQPQSAASTAQAETKAKPAGCAMMADKKAGEACCAHHPDGPAQSDMACCQGKDGKDAAACMKGDKDKSADACSCCSSEECCGGDGKAGCCSKTDKSTQQAAMACCSANSGHCGAGHHANVDK